MTCVGMTCTKVVHIAHVQIHHALALSTVTVHVILQNLWGAVQILDHFKYGSEMTNEQGTKHLIGWSIAQNIAR